MALYPTKGLGSDTQLIFENDANGRYKYWSTQDKPHGMDIPVAIDINDVRHLIVQSEEETKELQIFLEDLYSKDTIANLIGNGLLKIEYVAQLT